MKLIHNTIRLEDLARIKIKVAIILKRNDMTLEEFKEIGRDAENNDALAINTVSVNIHNYLRLQ